MSIITTGADHALDVANTHLTTWPIIGGKIGKEELAEADGDRAAQRVEIILISDMLDARIAEGSNVQITRREPSTIGKAVKQSTRLAPAAVSQRNQQREGEWRLAGA